MIKKSILLLVITPLLSYCQNKIVIDQNNFTLNKSIELESIQFIDSQVLTNLPGKALTWDNRLVFKTIERFSRDSKLIILDQNLNYLGSLETSHEGQPKEIREITDFGILNDQLVIYDFQSQKVVSYDKNLSFIKEKRVPYYLFSFEVTDDIIVAYSGKREQRIDTEVHYNNFITFDMEWNLLNMFDSFDPKRYANGVKLNPSPSLVKTANGDILYTEFWSDTIKMVRKDHLEILASYRFKSNGLKDQEKNLPHQEIYSRGLSGEWSDTNKGVTPISGTKDHLILSYSQGTGMKYAIYNIKKRFATTIKDYEVSVSERFMIPLFNEGDLFTSIVYPYELKTLYQTQLLDFTAIDISQIEALEKLGNDEQMILVKFRVNPNL